jgi:hypothetical protein
VKLIAISLVIIVAACDFARNVVWPAAVLCGVQEATELFKEVASIVEADGFASKLSDGNEARLEDLAAQHGARVVACILHALIDKYTPRGVRMAESEGDYQGARRSQRIQAFLDERDVEVLPPYGGETQ